MNIDPLKGQSSEGVKNVSRHSTLTTAAQMNTGSADDSELDLITQQNLLDQVKELPEVRTEVADIGRKLAEDPDYPTDEAIDKIASLLADLEPGWMDSIDAEVDDAPDANA